GGQGARAGRSLPVRRGGDRGVPPVAASRLSEFARVPQAGARRRHAGRSAHEGGRRARALPVAHADRCRRLSSQHAQLRPSRGPRHDGVRRAVPARRGGSRDLDAPSRLGDATLSPGRRPGVRAARMALSRRDLLLVLGAAGLTGLGACAVAPASEPLPDAALSADYILLGEVHDNPKGHALRPDRLRALPPGPSNTLVLEQFDRERQDALARWRADHPDARGADAARELALAGGFAFDAWDYEAYGPVIELALKRGWDVRAGNLSRADAMRVARDPAVAEPPPARWSSEGDAALESAVRAGHCGLVPEERIAAMALAQRSRDASMARAMLDARADGARQVIL